MGELFDFSPKLAELDKQTMEECAPYFGEASRIADINRRKVLEAFIKNRVGAAMFGGSTGYGFGDVGRDVLDRVFADIVGAEDAVCRPHLLSGTHALTVALFGILRPGDLLVSAVGEPYDTLRTVILSNGTGSLADFKIDYAECPLKDNAVDLSKLAELSRRAKAVLVQRSKGYSMRGALGQREMREIFETIKTANSDAIILVDNCYGEFCDASEPCAYGADLIAGSLIKNAGGAVAPCGGYIAGKKELVELCAGRMTAPGTGRELGCVPNGTRELFLGLYFAPTVTEQAVCSSIYASRLFEKLGKRVFPLYGEPRNDIVTVVELDSERQLCEFCRAIQACSPVDSFAVPEPWDMPGYDCRVIMAAGAFTNGSSIELSCDAPLKMPYRVYIQGGVHLTYSRLAFLSAAKLFM